MERGISFEGKSGNLFLLVRGPKPSDGYDKEAMSKVFACGT